MFSHLIQTEAAQGILGEGLHHQSSAGESMSLAESSAFVGGELRRAGVTNRKSEQEGTVAECLQLRSPMCDGAVQQPSQMKSSLSSHVDTSRIFGEIKRSGCADHVPDVLKSQQGSDESDLVRLQREAKEAVYRSTAREPLARSYQRGHVLPEKVKEPDFRFGIESASCESAKGLLYPKPSDAEAAGVELYRRSHHSYAPGEQVRRDYGVDLTSRVYGSRPGTLATNGASHNVAAALRMDSEGAGNQSGLRSKQVNAAKAFKDVLGKVRNLGMTDRSQQLSEDHVYGVSSKTRDWGAKECISGGGTWEEQLPDKDLGCSITPGFRNVTTSDRVFGTPTVRSDIPKVERRSLADRQNYGDEVGAGQLINAGQFASVGVEDEEFFCQRNEVSLPMGSKTNNI